MSLHAGSACIHDAATCARRPGPDSVDTPVPGPGSQESWTLDTAYCHGFPPGAGHRMVTPGAGQEGEITRTPVHLAPPSHSTRLATSTRLVTCYPPPHDNLSILTFSGAVKTITGDHVEIIYIVHPAVSVQYAVCMFVS